MVYNTKYHVNTVLLQSTITFLVLFDSPPDMNKTLLHVIFWHYLLQYNWRANIFNQMKKSWNLCINLNISCWQIDQRECVQKQDDYFEEYHILQMFEQTNIIYSESCLITFWHLFSFFNVITFIMLTFQSTSHGHNKCAFKFSVISKWT